MTVAGRTVGELLQAVGRVCPALGDLLRPDGSVSRQYLVSIDGERFVTDTTGLLPSGSRLLILGADAGG